MGTFVEFCKQLTDTVAPDIKELANGNVNSSTILKLSKKVDVLLYRNFGDEDLISKNNADKQVKNLSVYFNGMIQTADYVLEKLKNKNFDIEGADKNLINLIKEKKLESGEEGIELNEEDRHHLLFMFMMNQFTSKIIQFCLQSYLSKIAKDDPSVISVSFSKAIVNEYKNFKDEKKLRISLRKLIKSKMENEESFKEMNEKEKKLQIKQMVDSAIEEIKQMLSIIESEEKESEEKESEEGEGE